jgi:hypothetical protein
MKIDATLASKIKDWGGIISNETYWNRNPMRANNCPLEEATEIRFPQWIVDGMPQEFIGQVLKAPKKKEVTIEFLFYKFNKETVFQNFAKEFDAFLRKNTKLTCCATSYGIGVWDIFNSNSNAEIEMVQNALDEKGVKYHIEWSDAFWVRRFVISKSKENLARL